MKKNACLALCLLFLPLVSFANTNAMSFRCTLKSAQACEQAIATELKGQKCDFTESSLICRDSDSGDIYCDAVSSNCSDASSNGFTGVLCQKGSKATFQNRNITATWARSFLWIWVKNFCKE